MEACFPSPSLLPGNDDKDGTLWLDSVGIVRADLQLSALALVWEFQFLSPTGQTQSERWNAAKVELNRLLSTPAIDNLRQAKRLLRQLAEGVSEIDIVNGLRDGGAAIGMDPSIARPDRTIRFSVRFRQQNLNTAAARQLVTCHWTFNDSSVPRRGRIRSWFSKLRQQAAAGALLENRRLPEEGWYVHHYFEKDVVASMVSVNFFQSDGAPIALSQIDGWPTLSVQPKLSRRGPENWQRFLLEMTQLGAALLVPVATLASTTISGGSSGHWWELIAIGFGSDTIKNILVGKEEPQNPPQRATK